MKRNLILFGLSFTFFLAVTLFSGCGGQGDDEKPGPETLKVEDYFPITDNVRYVYEGMGNEYAYYDVYNEYTAQGLVQQRVDNGGTVLARVYEVKEGKLTRLLSRGETYYRENMLDKSDNSKEVLLMEPLEVGTTWVLTDGSERTITKVDADVSTPLGSYKAIEVVSKGKNDTVTDYYVKDIGLVKTVFTGQDYEVSSSLKEIEENAKRLESIQFYFPGENDKLNRVEKEVSFQTNDSTSQILEDAYKEAGAGNFGVVLSANAKINGLTLNEDNIVEIDLNSAFRTEMNAGSGYEGMILQSVADTFGKYYNAQEVILTIEGKPYASGHFEFKEGETIKVNYV